MGTVTIYGQRLAALMAEQGLSQYALAERSGVPQPTIQRLLSGETKNPKMDTLRSLARIVGESLITGAQEPPNIEPGPEIRGRVPLISWVQAGNFSETIDVFAPGVADEWVETITPVRAHTYALRVQGDSMMPMFAPGAILIVEPDMEPLPGDFVIAKNGEEATFKQLIKDGDDWLLKPMNERYPIKPLGNGRIVGVVRDVMMHLR